MRRNSKAYRPLPTPPEGGTPPAKSNGRAREKEQYLAAVCGCQRVSAARCYQRESPLYDELRCTVVRGSQRATTPYVSR